MLLSIDRVLQLIAEGKNIEKIAELADCEISDVASIIDKARSILLKYEKTESKRKIIIKKKLEESKSEKKSIDDDQIKDILSGAELAAIPVNTPLTINVGAKSDGNPGHSGIGIIVFDQVERQVGKVSEYIGIRTQHAAEHAAFIKALKLAVYFQAGELKIRTDSESIIREFRTDYKTKDNEIKKFLNDSLVFINKISKFRVEFIDKNLNDKALYLAEKGYSKVKGKNK